MKKIGSVLAILLPAFLLLISCGEEDDPATKSMLEDRVLGSPDAPVTIIEYASLTCPHCARFHTNTLPRLKRDWIDKGKAKLIFRDFPLDGNARTAAVIARCAPPEDYYLILDRLFRRQSSWARLDDPLPVLSGIAGSVGLDRAAIDTCLDNDGLEDGILQMRLDGQEEFGVDSTPSFVIQGRLLRGTLPYKEFDQLLRTLAARQAQ